MKRIMPIRTVSEVLDFWFSPKSSPDYLQRKSFWYGNTTADDDYVRTNLGDSYRAAKDGALDQWTQSDHGEGALALILLLDQVPRNIFRGTPQAYATDAKALAVAREVVQQRWDKGFPIIQRRYLYSPFNHSEDLKDQEVSVGLFRELGDAEHLKWATAYYEQIKRDGRFRHRDQALGR